MVLAYQRHLSGTEIIVGGYQDGVRGTKRWEEAGLFLQGYCHIYCFGHGE